MKTKVYFAQFLLVIFFSLCLMSCGASNAENENDAYAFADEEEEEDSKVVVENGNYLVTFGGETVAQSKNVTAQIDVSDTKTEMVMMRDGAKNVSKLWFYLPKESLKSLPAQTTFYEEGRLKGTDSFNAQIGTDKGLYVFTDGTAVFEQLSKTDFKLSIKGMGKLYSMKEDNDNPKKELNLEFSSTEPKIYLSGNETSEF